MNATSLQSLLTACTELEIAALQSSLLTWNGDFGFTDEITIAGKSKKAVGGVITSLLQKGILVRDDEFGQFSYVSWNDAERDFAADTVKNFLKGLTTNEAPAEDKKPRRKRQRKNRSTRLANKVNSIEELFRRLGPLKEALKKAEGRDILPARRKVETHHAAIEILAAREALAKTADAVKTAKKKASPKKK